MASKLWRVGKKLTLWGVLASALPFLFLPLMFLSALSVAFVVPLGCLVGSFICLRKFYTILYQKTLVGFKRKSLLEKSESATSEVPSSEVEIIDYSAENAENESIQSPFEEFQPEEYNLQKNNLYGETYEEEENPHEGEIDNDKPQEEEEPCEIKPHEVETQLQSDPHTIIPMEKPPEEERAPGEETQWSRENEEEALERENQLIRENEEAALIRETQLDPHTIIPMEKPPEEERAPGEETQWSRENEEEALERENQLIRENEEAALIRETQLDPHTIIPMEKPPEEERAPGEETQWSRENEEEALERENQLIRENEEAALIRETQLDPHTIIPMEKPPEEERAPGEETQCSRENDEEALERETQWSRENDEEALERETQLIRENEEAVLEIETQLIRETEEEALESETQLKSEELPAISIEKTSRIETKHKRNKGEEGEEEVPDEIREIPSKRSRHEEHEEFDSEQSAPHFNENNGTGNSQTLEIPSFSAGEAIQADSPLDTPSCLGSEYDAEGAYEATGRTNTPSLEVHVSSDSSNSVSEGTFEQDYDCVEKIWEEIHAVRKIVGYIEVPHPSYAEEIKALYVFTGVEPPGSLKDTFDMAKAKEKLEFLKAVVGVK